MIIDDIQPIDVGAVLHEKQEVIYALMKENAQLRESSARVAEDSYKREKDLLKAISTLEAERDEARADAKSWEQQADQRATELLAALKDNEKLLEERDAAVKRVGELESAIVDWETEPQYRVTKLNELHSEARRIITRRREEKGGE